MPLKIGSDRADRAVKHCHITVCGAAILWSGGGGRRGSPPSVIHLLVHGQRPPRAVLVTPAGPTHSVARALHAQKGAVRCLQRRRRARAGGAARAGPGGAAARAVVSGLIECRSNGNYCRALPPLPPAPPQRRRRLGSSASARALRRRRRRRAPLRRAAADLSIDFLAS